MSAEVAAPDKPRLLFVDDEKRVLNSMRAMFRRDYELFLTTRGDEALRIVAQQPIDVLVADQRMPLMSGVEVLTAAKKCSPGTVRILLTGYSDLDAIQGAMNDGEVFRFLNKPCAATELRGTIGEAARIARDTAQSARSEGASDSDIGEHDVEALSEDSAEPSAPTPIDDTAVEIVMAGDTVTVVDADESPHDTTAPLPPERPRVVMAPPAARVRCVGRGRYNISVMVFSSDAHFAERVGDALDGTFYTFHATNAVRLVEAVGRVAPAVLITDVTTDPDVIRSLTGMLKARLPALVTLVAGRHRDADVMIGLINHGQVFRFVDAPLTPEDCHRHVRDALRRHIVLRRNPALADRFSVRESDSLTGLVSERVLRGLKRVRSLWSARRGQSH
ncbi:MAG: response regulator [Pseudomonadota bacterium]